MFKYGFFNSIDGDRKYNADDISNFFGGIITNGIFKNYENELEVVAIGGMNISIKSGKALINYKYFYNTSDFTATIDAHSNFTRTDYIIAYSDLTERQCGIKVVKDVESGTNSELIETDTYKFIRLASIHVSTSATTIYDTDITDLRSSNWIQLTNLTATNEVVTNYSSIYNLSYDSNLGYYYIYVGGIQNITNAIVNVYFNGARMIRYVDYNYETSSSDTIKVIFTNPQVSVNINYNYQSGVRNEVAVEVLTNSV